MITLGIADDHRLFRKSLSYLLNSFDGINLVFEAKDGPNLIENLKKQPVELVLLDIQMPEVSGFEVCEKIARDFPETKILMLSQLSDYESLQRAFSAGASGYFTKNSCPEELEKAIKNIHQKGFYFEERLRTLFERLSVSRHLHFGKNEISITTREKEILLWSVREFSGKEIAEKLFISPRTVEVHKKNLMAKTGSKNFIGVIVHMFKHHIIELDEVERTL